MDKEKEKLLKALEAQKKVYEEAKGLKEEEEEGEEEE
jgi:hypothetical protein